MADTPIKERIENNMNACCYREHCRAQARRIAELERDIDDDTGLICDLQDHLRKAWSELSALRSRIDGALTGQIVEAGDDADGQPRVTVHCSRANLCAVGPIIFRTVHLVVEQEGGKS